MNSVTNSIVLREDV
jgi:hypothetical protein